MIYENTTVYCPEQIGACECCSKIKKGIAVYNDVRICSDCYFKTVVSMLFICENCGFAYFLNDVYEIDMILEKIDFWMIPCIFKIETCHVCASLNGA